MAENSMLGRVCLITGATNGIGKAAARQLAGMGAEVVIVGRNAEKTRQTVAGLQQETGSTHISALLADLADQAQVHRLAGDFLQAHGRLDVLINNAGAVNMRRQETPDGIELTLAVNHLAYFLLTHLLLDVLKASAPARIVNVSSSAHRYVGLELLDDFQFRNGYEGWQAYSRSKLMNLLFTYELARRLEGTGVTVNALHPGFVNTGIGRSNNTAEELQNTPLHRPGHLTSEDGAQTVVYLASSPEVEGVSGRYFDNCAAVESTPPSYDRAAAAALWRMSAELTGVGEGQRPG